MSNEHNIVIGLGMPVKTGNPKPNIGMFLFQPNIDHIVYTKKCLHTDELPFFSAGNDQLAIRCCGLNIVPAICYESLLPAHFEEALQLNADIYLASVAKSEADMTRSIKYYQMLSAASNKIVAVVNATGEVEGYPCVGKSTVWGNGVEQKSVETGNS